MLAAAAGDEPVPAEPAPSAELLLYLGEFEDAGGEFVDPLAIEQMQEIPADRRPAAQEADVRDGNRDESADPD